MTFFYFRKRISLLNFAFNEIQQITNIIILNL